jgi:hypothetical protein
LGKELDKEFGKELDKEIAWIELREFKYTSVCF